MNKLKWWFRIYGTLYVLMGLGNLYIVLLNPQGMADSLPSAMASSPLVVQAFSDAWSPFAFDVLGIGLFLLWASRNPLKHISVVWFVVWLEFLHGSLDDLFLIARGYDATTYIVFGVVHIAIIVTGVLFAREGATQLSPSAQSLTQKNAL